MVQAGSASSCRRERQADAEVRAGELAVDDFDRAAVRLHELRDDRQADAGAFDLAGRRGAAGVESLEYARALFRGDAGPVSATSSTSSVLVRVRVR